MSDIDYTTWKHWNELPKEETWCRIELQLILEAHGVEDIINGK